MAENLVYIDVWEKILTTMEEEKTHIGSAVAYKKQQQCSSQCSHCLLYSDNLHIYSMSRIFIPRHCIPLAVQLTLEMEMSVELWSPLCSPK